MNLTCRAGHWLVLGLLPAILPVAGCSSMRGLQQHTSIMQNSTPMAILPAEGPAVEIPAVPKPEVPRVASLMPNVKDLVVRKKPPPPKDVPAAKATESAVFAPADLVGFDFPSVLQVLRRPDSVQTSALSVVWTYSEPSCTLQLFFYPEIKTRTFRLLKHDLKSAAQGDAERTACMRDMMVMKTDEPALP
jgi:hypothetical protein